MKNQINNFKKFINAVYNDQDKIRVRPIVLIVKNRDGKIDVESYSDPEYANFSGATNNGTIFSQNTFKHSISNDALKTWNKLLADKEKAEAMLNVLANQNGVEAIIDDNDILTIKNYKVYETIFTI